MRYGETVEGKFISRPNRFLAWVQIEGQDTLCHVKNTGRCRELLRPGARVILTHHDTPGRKTAYSLTAVYKGDTLFNIDSQAPNQAVWEWITQRQADGRFGRIVTARREVTYGHSRFDLYLETEEGRRIFVEVKGVTLETDGTARFPDAPTERGLKHVRELTGCAGAGYGACLLFVLQMKGSIWVEPNWATQPDFGRALQEAVEAGVQILAYDCLVTPDSMQLDRPVAVRLEREEDRA